MKSIYLNVAVAMLVAVLVTYFFSREDQPLESSSDALKVLTQSGSVAVEQDTLVYTLMGEELTYNELNALKYLADDFYAVKVANLETKYAKQQLFECENGVKPYPEGVVEEQ